MEDNTFDLNDLPEEVLNEIAEGEVFEIEEAITEEAPVTEEAPAKQTDNEIIDELVAAAEKKVVKKPVDREPGMYHKGRKIQGVPSRLGKKWVVVIDGRREKVLKSEIEFVKNGKN